MRRLKAQINFKKRIDSKSKEACARARSTTRLLNDPKQKNKLPIGTIESNEEKNRMVLIDSPTNKPNNRRSSYFNIASSRLEQKLVSFEQSSISIQTETKNSES